MRTKNLFTLVLIAVFAFALASADQKGKKAPVVKKETKGCCMDAKATKVSNEKSSTHAMTAKHEHGKGMDCDMEHCMDKDGKTSSKEGKDCCKEMTKAETKSGTPAPKE